MKDVAVAFLLMGLFSLFFGFPLTLMLGKELTALLGSDSVLTFMSGILLGMSLMIHLTEDS